MEIKTITFEMFPERKLYVAYFDKVTNAAELQKALRSQELDFALINPNMVVDAFQLEVAATRSLLFESKKSLITNSLHSELVYNLSGSRNVSDAFRRFGIANDNTQLLVGVFDASDKKLEDIQKAVHGELVSISKLTSKSDEDIALVKKAYKIQTEELNNSTLLNSIITRISTKCCNK